MDEKETRRGKVEGRSRGDDDKTRVSPAPVAARWCWYKSSRTRQPNTTTRYSFASSSRQQ
jgi:hypothetical protein